MKEGGGEGRKRVSLHSSPPPARSFTRTNFGVVFDSRSSFFASKPNGKLATQVIVTANAQLSEIYGAVYSLGLQCFSKVFRVLFRVKTEAFETDSNNNIDTDSQNEFKTKISIETIVTIIMP